MKIFEGNNISEVYELALNELENSPIIANTKEINNAIFIVHNPSLKNLYFPRRKISEKYAIAELEWYWSADNKCETIGKYAKLWLSITDDGVTNNSAYGYIIHKKYGFDQLQQIIELLKKDSNTRRAVLNISDPSINRITTKDMQCTIGLQFLIRNNKLEETVYMRSNDIRTGTPYDVIYFISLGYYIATQLNIEFSLYTHIDTSLHMYLKDVDKFKEHNEIINIDIDEIIRRCYENK